MTGDLSDLQRRAAAIAAASIAALGAHHDTDGDSVSSSGTAITTLSVTRKGGHAAPVCVDHALKRMKLNMPITPPTPTSVGAAACAASLSGRSHKDDDDATLANRTPRCGSGSESDGASSSAAEPRKHYAAQQLVPARKVRVRKPTYAVRKEEKDVLVKEIHLLEAQVAFLKERAGLSVGRTESKLGESLHLNDAIREALRQQQLALARSQSAVLQCLSVQHTNPMSSLIRLGKTWHERRATLLALKDKKLRDAYEYVAARSQLLDPLNPHVTDERFETAAGDYCCVRFETIQFEGLASAKQVYDALLHYVLNMEEGIAEHLGHVTTREAYDLVDKSLSNHRLLSTEHGVEIELNGVMFAQFDDAYALAGGVPCGIVAVDSVDDDELYPYARSGRVRKDISATCVITQERRRKPGSMANDDHELVVVMTRGAFLRLHHSDVELSPQTQLEIRDGIARWGHAMIKCINDMLYPEADASSE